LKEIHTSFKVLSQDINKAQESREGHGSNIQRDSMQSAKTITFQYSAEFQKLAAVFSHIHAPYTEQDVRSFNAIYSGLYKNLKADERELAERMVDTILDDLERKELATLIYGVV
jgi:hypothetical protein